MCRAQPSKQVYVVTTEQSGDESDDSLYQLEEVGAVHHQQTKQFFTALQVLETAGDTEIQCQLDIGATCNVMTLTDLCNIKQCGNPHMNSSTARLRLYNGPIIPVLGEVDLRCKVNERQETITFKVIPGNRIHCCQATLGIDQHQQCLHCGRSRQ